MNYTEKIQEKIFLSRLNSFDSEVFIEIYHFYVDRIFRFLFIRVKNKEDAEDLASEVFMKTWQYVYKKQNTIVYLNAFLYQTARNLIADYFRKIKDDVSADSEASHAVIDEKQMSFEQKIDISAKYSEMEKALEKLKDEYREVIVLSYIEDLSCSEISKIMNRSRGAVRILLHRAMKDLRKNLTS